MRCEYGLAHCTARGKSVVLRRPEYETRSGDKLDVMVMVLCDEHINDPQVAEIIVKPERVRADKVMMGDTLFIAGRLFPVRYAGTGLLHMEGDSRPTNKTTIGLGSFSLGADVIEYSYARPWDRYQVIR